MPVSTPTSNRLHIALVGRRNAGKSSLINALTGQHVALVSEVPGTTTDPVFRPMELHPFGPVVLIDTAGLDDEGALGRLRVERTLSVLDRTDLAVLVVEPGVEPSLPSRQLPMVGAVTKADLDPSAAAEWAAVLTKRLSIPFVACSAVGEPGVDELRKAIVKAAPQPEEPPLLADLVNPGDLVLLVMPQDAGAPKGRLILPQVQALREVLDAGAIGIAVQDGQLMQALANLWRLPDLVVTDSQVFGKVNQALPPEVPLTSFSILMARHKGDLRLLADGARAIDSLRPGDRVLIAETCTHHAQKDDIGTVKLPKWLRAKVGGELAITWAHGKDLPSDLGEYKLVIHCGGCMVNRQLMMSRLRRAAEAGIPIVNYGVAIAHLHGILPRTLTPFHELEVAAL